MSAETDLFLRAFKELSLENDMWRRNFNIYVQWDEYHREWYIARIKLQAQKDIPVALALVRKATEIRLRGINGNQSPTAR